MFVGRQNEIKRILNTNKSQKSEFIAVYGRRRVGKTYLIRNTFDKKISFQISGLANATLKEQLENFYITLNKQSNKKEFSKPKNWLTALGQLEEFLETKRGRKIIFIDELPWFDTPKSKFIQALEHFWNSWASARRDVTLIVCGSAASWMTHKLINNRGGLHNRVSLKIKLEPFSLNECEQYVKARKIHINRYQIIQLYMTLGGVPYYWDEVKAGLSATQNIQNICFAVDGLLKNEFNNLFRSLFNNSENHIKIIETLATKSSGLNREELIKLSKLANAGSTTRILNELEESGFIRKYIPFGKKVRNSLYQLSDVFSLFYLKFMKNTSSTDGLDWNTMIDSPQHRVWSGYSYEQVALWHIPQIKNALGISGIQTKVSSWRTKDAEKGAQIDLIIDRRDQTINLCEAKFSINPYSISKKYASELRNKIGLFKSETQTRKSVFLTMITTFGIEENINSTGLVQNSVTMEDLFTEI